jgi:hypothetical protein
MAGFLKRPLLICFLLLSSWIVNAQPGGGPPPPHGEPVPLSGLEWLFVSGALLGVGRLLQKKRFHKTN